MNLSFVDSKKDFWLLGFASLICWGAILLLHGFENHWVLAGQSLRLIENAMPMVLILTSYPHLLISFKYGYGQGTSFTTQNWPQLIAAPATLIGAYGLVALTWSVPIGSHTLGRLVLSFIFNIFLLGSGWHAMRQVYGITLLYSGFKHFKFSAFQRKMLLINLYSVFLIDFVNLNQVGNDYALFGMQFAPLGFGPIAQYCTYALTSISALILVFSLATRSAGLGAKVPPKEALAAIGALYLWALPCFFLPEFTIFAPNIFHSIQYFAVLYKVEKPQGVQRARLYWLKKWAIWTLAGAILIKFLPALFDQWITFADEQNFGFFSFCVFTFANLHHYSIDSCIWKAKSGSKLLGIVQQPVVFSSRQVIQKAERNQPTTAAS